jgi:hypothetical protein
VDWKNRENHPHQINCQGENYPIIYVTFENFNSLSNNNRNLQHNSEKKIRVFNMLLIKKAENFLSPSNIKKQQAT